MRGVSERRLVLGCVFLVAVLVVGLKGLVRFLRCVVLFERCWFLHPSAYDIPLRGTPVTLLCLGKED